MIRVTLLVTVALAAIGAAVAVMAATGTAQEPGEQTVKLVERPLTGHLVDNPPKATRRGSPLFSAGDLTVASTLRRPFAGTYFPAGPASEK